MTTRKDGNGNYVISAKLVHGLILVLFGSLITGTITIIKEAQSDAATIATLYERIGNQDGKIKTLEDINAKERLARTEERLKALEYD